jgi:predicted ATPase
MDLDNINGFTLLSLAKKNVILGKNGCGKSYLLKQVAQGLRGREGFGKVRYISPERGGILEYQPGIEQTISQNPDWMEDQRRRNQSDNFRQQSATLFRRLELLVLREIEREHRRDDYVPQNFGDTIAKINVLLDRVRLARDNSKAFKIIDRDRDVETTPNDISSGESELISLGIEFLSFVKECESGEKNFLLVDEPDVHLHPDLQDRLALFIIDVLKEESVHLILATHSTALLSALATDVDTRVAFMRRKDSTLNFKPVSDVNKSILPIFGAHPLSNVFNQAPVLMIEGEDDERVWQQAIRSSAGRIHIHPCVVDGLTHFAEFEAEVNNIIESVYDDACGFSLRDRDQHPELSENVGHVIRMRLSCRAAENLMLCDECLDSVGLDWPAFQDKLRAWAEANRTHQYRSDVQVFIDTGFDRRNCDLKTIRNIVIGLMSNKPWEVLVGQTIANLSRDGGNNKEGSIRDFLGEKVCKNILNLPPIN